MSQRAHNTRTAHRYRPSRHRALDGRLPKLVAGVAIATVYWFPIRRWFSRYGSTPAELAPRDARRPADGQPDQTDTQAVTVNAPPDDGWPWLVQMGYQRGGLYSYDWLDRLFGFLDRPSECQARR